jgi:mycolipenoyl-CoA---2-(long-chain-fatty acyl)-trehalose mycolipenoyltransferase / long-chain-acyl-CoA---trehalose acyltransferase
MKPISFEDFRPEPGLLVEWTVSTETAFTASLSPADPTPLSYNQKLHLQAAHSARGAGLTGNPWIGLSFEIEGAADIDALGRTFTAWLRRHEALRSGFRAREAGIERFTLAADAIALRHDAPVVFSSSEALHAQLEARFAAGTDPFAWPPLVLGVISREAGSTVFIALDHVAGDGFSLTLAVWELQATYEAFLANQEPLLPETGSFHDLCVAEREFGDAITPDDPAVQKWRKFIADCGGTAPTFPLDLGVVAGQSWPQTVYTRLILRPEEAAAFEASCTRGGGGFFAGMLASMAIAIQAMTGQKEFRTVTPLHTRRKPVWRAAMGWFITCAPLDFSLEGASGFTDVLPRAQLSVLGAVRLAAYPALRIIELLGDDFRITRRDLFSMVSYTDYRKLRGGERHSVWKPVTIGRVTEADDSHVWLSRQHDGLHISVRHPDTPIASGVLDEYVRLIQTTVAQVRV